MARNANQALQQVALQMQQLVAQMQLNPAPQVNELNLISYPDFYGGEQDPMTWIEEIAQAFNANRVPAGRELAIIIPHLKGSAASWWINRRNQIPVIDRWNDINAQ